MEYLISYIKQALLWLIQTLVDGVLVWLLPILQTIGSLIPAEWKPSIEAALSWLSYLETWVPFVFGFQMLTAYYTIKIMLIIVQKILKAIPTIW